MAADELVNAPAWFAGKSIEELHAIEHHFEGDPRPRLLIPEALTEIDAKGANRSEEIMVEVPDQLHRANARIEALQFVARMVKRDQKLPLLTVDEAKAAIGPELFENFDSAAILCQVMRERKAPHGPAYKLGVFITSWKPSTWFALYDRLDFYARLWDPRFSELSEEQFWAMTREIARVKNLSPFRGIDASGQHSFITRLAAELWSYRTRSLRSDSPQTSTQAS